VTPDAAVTGASLPLHCRDEGDGEGDGAAG